MRQNTAKRLKRSSLSDSTLMELLILSAEEVHHRINHSVIYFDVWYGEMRKSKAAI